MPFLTRVQMITFFFIHSDTSGQTKHDPSFFHLTDLKSITKQQFSFKTFILFIHFMNYVYCWSI